MGWERDYEHFRDMGHTWGPGIDDAVPLTEEEERIERAREEAFLKKLEGYRVPPREQYRIAGETLSQSLPSRTDIIYGNAPMGWREKYSREKLKLCKEAAESLGYSLKRPEEGILKDNLFTVRVDYYGFLPGKGGNIHPVYTCDITSLEDCLQLVSDYKAIGMDPATCFGKEFHFHCSDTGRLRYELEDWSKRNKIKLPSKQSSLDRIIQLAKKHLKPTSKTISPEKER